MTDPVKLYPNFLWSSIKTHIEGRPYPPPKSIFGLNLAKVSTTQLFSHRFLDPVTSLEQMVVGESMESARRKAKDISFKDIKDTMRDRKPKKKISKNKEVTVEENEEPEVQVTLQLPVTPERSKRNAEDDFTQSLENISLIDHPEYGLQLLTSSQLEDDRQAISNWGDDRLVEFAASKA